MSFSTVSGLTLRRVLVGLVGLAVALAAVLWTLHSSGSGSGSGKKATGAPVAGGISSTGDPSATASAGQTTAGAKHSGMPTISPSASSTNGATVRQGTGSLEPVPYEEVTPKPAIPLSATADFGTGLTLKVTDVEPVRSVARRPGEISAPAVRISMQARNGSSRPILLDGMAVSVDYGTHRTPAIEVAEPGGDPFQGTLAAGHSRRGVYIFNVPKTGRDGIHVTTSYAAAAPTLVFTGSAA